MLVRGRFWFLFSRGEFRHFAWVDCAGDFAAPAARYFPSDGKVPKGSPGDAAGANSVRHDGLPPDPHYGGRVPVGFCSISGAQNLSDSLRLYPGHWALRRRGFRIPRFALSDKARSLHRSSSPTQTRCAGLCVGGRLRRPAGGKNFKWCGFCSAPGLAEQMFADPLSAGRSGTGPYNKNRRLPDLP